MHFVRTDLAIESTATPISLPEGTRVYEETCGTLKVTHVEVTKPEAAKILERSCGHYITIELPNESDAVDSGDDVTHALSKALVDLLPKSGLILVAGLGNEQMTPDSLGPCAIRGVLVTRHFPKELAESTGLSDLRSVAATAPGVLGQTGIESSEIIHALVRDITPAAVLVIDAFAARSLSRLGRTIQLADCGISPGSGVQNARKELSQATLGVPVVSIGVPTVVDGATLVCDLLGVEDDPRISKEADSMMVTPRDIDALIKRSARQISLAINVALQPTLSIEDITYLVS